MEYAESSEALFQETWKSVTWGHNSYLASQNGKSEKEAQIQFKIENMNQKNLKKSIMKTQKWRH